jgi:Zn-dependent peptidase ImmA (M78 family)
MTTNARRELILRAAARAELVRVKCDIPRTAAVDSLLVAEKRGCEVRFMALPSLEGVYSPTPRSVIILGSQRPAGRRAFTCAHELGHHEFKHGARIEQLKVVRSLNDDDPDEFLADMFAACLLMSQGCVRRALKDRGIQPVKAEPMQIFRLASFLGVGYGTLIDHMTWTLKLLPPQQRDRLLQVQPKELKAQFGGAPQSEVILVDGLWRNRAVDLEIGDLLVLHQDAFVEDSPRLISKGRIDGQETFKAVSRGYLRAIHNDSGWAVNIRVASKHYEGLTRYRFLEDEEDVK